MIKKHHTLQWNEQTLTQAWEAIFCSKCTSWLTDLTFRRVYGFSGALPDPPTKALELQNITNPFKSKTLLNTRESEWTTFFSCTKWVLKYEIYKPLMNCITLVKIIVDLLLWPHLIKEKETLEPGCRSAQWDPRELIFLYLNGLRQIFKGGSCLSQKVLPLLPSHTSTPLPTIPVGGRCHKEFQLNALCTGLLPPRYLCQLLLKGPDSKYFRHSDSTLPLQQETSHRQYVSEWAQLCSNKNWFTNTLDRLHVAHGPEFAKLSGMVCITPSRAKALKGSRCWESERLQAPCWVPAWILFSAEEPPDTGCSLSPMEPPTSCGW